MNEISFVFLTIAAIGSAIIVVGFLGASVKDCCVLFIPVVYVLVHILEKRIARLHGYVKYAYMACPVLTTCVLVISNDGKFAAITQFYFFWLLLSVAYCNVRVIIFGAAATILSTFFALIFFSEAMLKLDTYSIWLYILVIYLMAVFLAVIIAKRMRGLIRKARQIKRYEDELFYLKQLGEKEEKHSEFIHNINHYFKVIGELAREENCGQILHFVQELNLNIIQNERIIYIYHKVVNAILTEAKSEAMGAGIAFDVYVEPNVHFGNIADSDLVGMFGNLLDNALEAAAGCIGQERGVRIRIYMENEGRVCVVKLMNHFARRPVQTKKGFVSSKQDKSLHGIGVRSTQNTAEKYGGYLQCLFGGTEFMAILILPVK